MSYIPYNISIGGLLPYRMHTQMPRLLVILIYAISISNILVLTTAQFNSTTSITDEEPRVSCTEYRSSSIRPLKTDCYNVMTELPWGSDPYFGSPVHRYRTG